MANIYLHRKLVFSILFFGVISILIGMKLMEHPISILSWVFLLFSIGLTLLGLYALWHQRFNKELKTTSAKDLEIEFKKNQIIFPKGYYFKYSKIKKNTILQAEDITEINLNTSPPSFVIYHNEVIFIPYPFKQELEAFGDRNKILIANRFDIWSAINEPFLDTEFDQDYIKKNIDQLVQNGLKPEEIKSIRGKIRHTMMTTNALVWEWINLSQFDYLNWTRLTKKKYWWSMKIALRNYKKQ